MYVKTNHTNKSIIIIIIIIIIITTTIITTSPYPFEDMSTKKYVQSLGYGLCTLIYHTHILVYQGWKVTLYFTRSSAAFAGLTSSLVVQVQ